MKKIKQINDVYDELEKSWPSPLVARSEVSKFSGGILHPRSMANLDSTGTGPPRIKIGKRIVGYPVKDLVAWMKTKTTYSEENIMKVEERETQNGKKIFLVRFSGIPFVFFTREKAQKFMARLENNTLLKEHIAGLGKETLAVIKSKYIDFSVLVEKLVLLPPDEGIQEVDDWLQSQELTPPRSAPPSAPSNNFSPGM